MAGSVADSDAVVLCHQLDLWGLRRPSCRCGNRTQSCVHRSAATQKFLYIWGEG
uniref:Galectin like n=1 Tax=Gorilla gorilla gorilla TaxID=9595 RepID=A0A2I2Y1L3_GORGO